MQELSLSSMISLYALLGIMGLYSALLFAWQLAVLRGRAMQNPDGSCDSWHQQKLYFGIAFADLVLSCPANLAGIAFVFIAPRWGFYLLAMVGFW